VVVGGVVGLGGGVAAAAAVGASLTGPAAPIGAGVGAIIGLICGFFAQNRIGKVMDEWRVAGDAILGELTHIATESQMVELMVVQDRVREMSDKSELLLGYLIEHGYLEVRSREAEDIRKLRLREEKFKTVASYYPEADRYNLIFSMKLMILLTLGSLPPDLRPTGEVMRQLEDLTNSDRRRDPADQADRGLYYFAIMSLARTYVQRFDLETSIQKFEEIPLEAGRAVYDLAQDNIRQLRAAIERRTRQVE
jgi:hypothetical protein